MKRRDFLLSLAAGTAGLCNRVAAADGGSDALGAVLPRRRLGSTGEAVTLLGIGGFHVGWTGERDAQEVIEAALEGGIRFFDTAEAYQGGRSEERYGKLLTPKYRDHVFLMTKTKAADAKTAREHLEGSLRRMRTDVIDLWQMHNLRGPGDADERLEAGVLEVLLEAQAEGKVRHIGFTGHSNPEAHLRMLERTAGDRPFAACQMPVNIVDPSANSFVERVIPKLGDPGIGLLAMKTLADGRFFAAKTMPRGTVWETDDPIVPGHVSISEALHFVWSLPVSVLITGAENATLVREKAGIARSFAKMDAAARRELVSRVAGFADRKVEYYKRPPA